MNKFFEKLPFKKLAEKIPAGTRAKVPLLDKAIPFANQIVCGLAVLLVVTVVACSGKGGSSGGSSGSKVKFTMAKESDFEVSLAPDGTAIIDKYTGNAGYNGSSGNIAVPATIQGVQVTKIGDSAFYNKIKLTGVQLPEGIKEIGRGAFEDTGISTIIIPDSVTVFGKSIFAVEIAYSTVDEFKQLRSFTFPAGLIASKKIPEGMFTRSGLSGSLIIPEGIETIEWIAFQFCQNLTSVTLPSTIKRIGEAAFSSCTELTEVVIPASVTSIQWDRAILGQFEHCPKLNLASQSRLKELGYTGSF